MTFADVPLGGCFSARSESGLYLFHYRKVTLTSADNIDGPLYEGRVTFHDDSPIESIDEC